MHKVDCGWLLRYGIEAGKAFEKRGRKGIKRLSDAMGKEGEGKWPLAAMGMRSVCDQARRLLKRSGEALEGVWEEESRPGGKASFEEAYETGLREAEKLLERWDDALKERVVLVLDPSAARLYSECAFDSKAQLKFFRAGFDMMEAQKCLALERYTACVYHLMKVLERGLRGIVAMVEGVVEGKEEGEAWFAKNWTDVLDVLDREIEKSKKRRSSWFKEREQFLSELRLRMRAVRDAWRNPTMHLAGPYSEVEAREIFDLSKGLMRRICLELKS